MVVVLKIYQLNFPKMDIVFDIFVLTNCVECAGEKRKKKNY